MKMDRNSEIIDNFERLLKTRSIKNSPALYVQQNETPNTSKNQKTYSVNEVMANISKQLKAIQNADTTYRRISNEIDKYKKREFLPVDMLPVPKEVPKTVLTKFDTQCVTDTQLFNVIENAEIVDKHRGITQEFDETFCQNSDEIDCDNRLNDGSLKTDIVTDTAIDNYENNNIVDKKQEKGCNVQSELFDNSELVTCELDTVSCHENSEIRDLNGEEEFNISQETEGFNKCVMIHDESNVSEERSRSPVLNVTRRNTTPPLVVSLYTFEEFENLANPIIEEQENFETAKNLINSQILGREISIPDNIYENINRESPVLNKIESITINVNRYDLDKKNRITPTFIDKDITCNQSDESSSENMKIESKVIKTEIKDEILFSSDEEYDYIHKDIQELPLTCALETSFYDKSDILDKTMYVGFQTASNKSIQIHTDSFMKAKSILSFDCEETETSLKDLVEIFDTGKSMNENSRNIELNCRKQYDTGTESLCENGLKINEDLVEENTSNTNQNVGFTARNQEENGNDDFVMSQVIKCKSTPKPATVNRSIISDNKPSDTNKQLDDDIVMSQVIEFKSLSRTQKTVNTSVNKLFKTPEELNAKRKLEDLNTVSNKKVKLTDKSLARCSEVFQDIDIKEIGDSSDRSNPLFNDATSSKIKTTGNHGDTKSTLLACDSIKPIASVKEINNSQFKTEIINDDKQMELKDVDFEINDEELLQEFEDNEMPFEKLHNNVYVGFKTASHKNISISDTALAKTRNLFEDIMNINTENDDVNENPNKPAEVFKNPSIDFKKARRKEPDVETEKFVKPVIKKDESAIDDLSEPPKIDFIGFKTASNKEIKISDQALEKTKHFYKDLDRNPINACSEEKITSNVHKENVNDVEDNFNCGIDTQDFLGEELAHIEDLFKDNIIANEKPLSPTFQGFQTASKKCVVISKTALEKGKKFFDDFIITEYKLTEDTNIRESNFKYKQTTGVNDLPKKQETDVAIVQTTVKETIYTDKIEDNIRLQNPTCTGFKTTNSRPIKISAAAIEKSGKVLDLFVGKDDDIDNIMVDNNCQRQMTIDPKPSTSTFLGFQTASNKKIKISAKALAESKQILNDFEPNDDEPHEYEAKNNTKPRFSTNKLIWNHEKNNFGTESDNNSLSTSNFVDFKTASNKEVKISSEALAKSKRILQEKENDMLDEVRFESEEKASGGFKGFQTANNKKISVSEKALRNSKRLFQDIDLKYENHEGASIYRGETANNKQVAISETALVKSKELFQDIYLSCDEENHKMDHPHETPVFKGFQTASNKKVEISEKALAKSKKLFDDLGLSEVEKDPRTNNRDCSPVFNGFQTASNKKVEISEKALAKSKKLFDDLSLSEVEKDPRTNDQDYPPVFNGFQTASNKKVQISEKALAKSKKLFDDLDLSQVEKDHRTNNRDCSPVGFQTASNKKVEISEKALAKSKKLFDDLGLSEVEKDPRMNDQDYPPVFNGFQTASNKKVQISEKALAKSKQLFEDIQLSQIDKGQENVNLENETNKKQFEDLCGLGKDINTSPDLTKSPVFVKDTFERFHTGNNRKVKLSEQALVKTKDTFQDKTIRTPEVKIKSHSNCKNNLLKHDVIGASTEDSNALINVIDTQVLNDFQHTQNTEDFCKSTPKSKRSGSPILSCPRAKKRKFETPYRSKKQIEPKNVFIPPQVSKTFNFDPDYKKNKTYTLKDLDRLEREHTKTGINPNIGEYKFDSLLNFKFVDSRNDYTEGKIGIEELKKIFLDSVNRKLVPDGWLDNHIRLIFWKLLSYEVKYPNVMKNVCSVRNVLEQLKYRYDRELYHVQRPILRKILEKDEAPSKTMILCVAGIYVDNISVTSVPPATQNMELLLTDGWYCVKAATDRMLVRLAATGSIVVGTKLAVCGAELINCEQGVAPWEDTSSVRLKLSGNSVRRARWFASLGVCAHIMRCPLRAVKPDGGRIASLRALVTRVYPSLYVEKMEDGSTVTLSERLDNIRQTKYESERQAVMEKLYEEVEKEMSDQDSQDSEGCSNERSGLDTGSQISKYMKKSKDPDECRSHLTNTQNRMLEEHNAKQREKLMERTRLKFQRKLEKTGLKTDRNVIQLLKVRIAGVERDGVEVTKGYLSVWRPSGAVQEMLTEGAWIEILNVIPTGIRNSEIQLSAGRQTVFNPYKQTSDKFKLYSNTLRRKCYEIGELARNPSMTTDYSEIDTVGVIISIEPSTREFKGNPNFQNVYLADADKNILCVNFWGGLKKFGFENILDTGQIVTCVNLQRAGNTRKSIPEYRVTEFSYFTKTPKDKKALEITNELSNKLLKIKDKFCEDCVAIKNNSVCRTRNNENVSPYNNYNTKIISPYTNRDVKMASPMRNDLNLNLTGLDFDTSFDTQDISPQLLLRKRKINEKIEKIRMYYGEPPPLSSIHIINQSKNASATYKSPLVLNSERPNVASVQNTGLMESPVSMNRTYVKNINPVKLNFSKADTNDNVDHFAEEFDASPPLSLDSDILN